MKQSGFAFIIVLNGH